MKRSIAMAILLACLLSACAAKAPVEMISITPIPTERPVPSPTLAPTPAPAETPLPTATPGKRMATIGFVGDILIMTSQISRAKQIDGSFDFSGSFQPMEGVFAGTGFVCGNFECTLSGAEAGYTEPKATLSPEETPSGKPNSQTFNAPDELAGDLRRAGFDLLSTANNHCMDRGLEGLFRTAEMIRAEGMTQLGTFTDAADAAAPRVVEVNGISIGFVAAADYVNRGTPGMGEAKEYAALLTREREKISSAIAACQEAGAEFIIVIIHWGTEHDGKQSPAQEKYADWLISEGADAIIGSHPHVVQPMEWRSGERDGETVRAPVAYSLGNFISNMPQENCSYGAFARLTIEKEHGREAECTGFGFLPLLCSRESGEHAVYPCFATDEGERARAFRHVVNTCGAKGILTIGREEYAGKTQGLESAKR